MGFVTRFLAQVMLSSDINTHTHKMPPHKSAFTKDSLTWRRVHPAKNPFLNLYIKTVHTISILIKNDHFAQTNTHKYTPLPSTRPVTQNVTLASGVYPPPPKLKQGGQKDIFQFSRCESFHLVIQMSLVFCVNRCPYPASFISIS